MSSIHARLYQARAWSCSIMRFSSSESARELSSGTMIGLKIGSAGPEVDSVGEDTDYLLGFPVMTDSAPNFEGHEPRECGEHRTVGSHRAWCYDCSMWCYPSREMACSGCELPALRREVEEYRQLHDRMADLLTATANALKGPPRALVWHDWADLPKVAADLVTYTKRNERRLADIAQAHAGEVSEQLAKPKWVDPPDGWMPFGAHANMTGGPPLEFHEELAEDLLPKWERCVTGTPAPDPAPTSDLSPSRQHPDEPAMQEPPQPPHRSSEASPDAPSRSESPES